MSLSYKLQHELDERLHLMAFTTYNVRRMTTQFYRSKSANDFPNKNEVREPGQRPQI